MLPSISIHSGIFKWFIVLFIVAVLAGCKTKNASSTATAAVIPQLELLQETPNLSHAESVAYDPLRDVLYVSVQGEQEPGDGSIAVLNIDGTLKNVAFTTGLNNPKGIAVLNDILYVSDVTMLVAIDLNTGKIRKQYSTGDEQFLNDVAIDVQGNVYLSDMRSSSIYRLDNKGNYTKWLTSLELENPNGLLAVHTDLYVAGWGLPGSENNDGNTQGRFLKMDMNTQLVTKITALPLGNLDGIQVYDNDHFLVSDWRNGSIFKISKTGDVTLFMQSEASVGDILYIQDKKLLVLPLNRQNKVQLYQVTNK